MKPNGLLAAVAVLAVLGGLVWWTGKHPSAAAPATPAAPKILTVAEDQIEGIRLAKAAAEPIVLKKLAGTWVIAEPKQLTADQDVVKQLTGSVAALSADRLIDEHPGSLSEFGLGLPAEEVDITLKSGAVTKVLLGGDTPSGTDTYTKLEGKAAVYTIASSTKSNFDKSVNDLRDKRLLPFNQDKVTAISVTSKGPAFEFGRNAQGEWQITRPRPLRADSIQVDDFVRKLKEAKMDLAAPVEPAKVGAKAGSVAVTDNSGTQTLEIYKPSDAKETGFYAKGSAVQGTYKLAGDFGEALKDKDVDSFRNKKLFDFGFNDPSKIEIVGAAYTKSGDKWMGPAGQVDAPSIQSVIDKLRELSAMKFSDRPAGAQALALTVTSGDNHKVEKVVVNKSGDEYNALREGEPAVYQVDAKAFDDLQKAISGIRHYTPPRADKK
ncbi:MAG: DUF4340 domain-containing protein [Acidobacteriota bacterium]|nr:DUF4340 domain-containing protein [Acidobacteriota bacterium]